ncbi:MAG: LexA repressor, repressor LexA [Patescibacteria group bacterium]|jgi:repressor LexA|nr:LexA repressor, repressor LexA [Patescibacteria group bacterium]
MEPLTKRQAQILEYVTEYIAAHNYAPSYREIGHHFGLSSTATIAEHIESLKQKGYLSHEENLARSIQPTTLGGGQDESSISIPLLGLIAAGKPIEASYTNETIDIPRDMMGSNVFALRVRGESMIEDGILNGDYVIVEQTRVAKNGDIVVALVDNSSVTLKRFYKEKDRIRLQPANSSMSPIFLRKVTIQGKVKGVIRKFI